MGKKNLNLKNIISGKTPGRGAANPNFPYGEMVDPMYAPNSGNPPIDPEYGRPIAKIPAKKLKKISKAVKRQGR